MENKTTQVGARLPPVIYRWIRGKVCTENNPSGEYRSMSQALIGELTKAKMCEDLSLIAPRPRGELCQGTP